MNVDNWTFIRPMKAAKIKIIRCEIKIYFVKEPSRGRATGIRGQKNLNKLFK